jgi:hypothetical protein
MKYFLTLLFLLSFNFGIRAQNDIVLISHNNYLVGAAQSGKWIKDADVAAQSGKSAKYLGFDSLKNEKPFEIFGITGEKGGGANYFYFGKTAKTPESIFDETTLKPTLAIGANANWNPLPRAAKKLAVTNKIYQKIALDFLKTKGMTAKTIKLEKAFSVDLEGDGADEIFLEATTNTDKNGEFTWFERAGNYSFVMMRKIVGGKPKDFLVEGNFNPRKEPDEGYHIEYDLSAFADLNGDGKLEVIVEGTYSYAGTSTEIYESDKNVLKKVLSVECGD